MGAGNSKIGIQEQEDTNMTVKKRKVIREDYEDEDDFTTTPTYQESSSNKFSKKTLEDESLTREDISHKYGLDAITTQRKKKNGSFVIAVKEFHCPFISGFYQCLSVAMRQKLLNFPEMEPDWGNVDWRYGYQWIMSRHSVWVNTALINSKKNRALAEHVLEKTFEYQSNLLINMLFIYLDFYVFLVHRPQYHERYKYEIQYLRMTLRDKWKEEGLLSNQSLILQAMFDIDDKPLITGVNFVSSTISGNMMLSLDPTKTVDRLDIVYPETIGMVIPSWRWVESEQDNPAKYKKETGWITESGKTFVVENSEHVAIDLNIESIPVSPILRNSSTKTSKTLRCTSTVIYDDNIRHFSVVFHRRDVENESDIWFDGLRKHSILERDNWLKTGVSRQLMMRSSFCIEESQNLAANQRYIKPIIWPTTSIDPLFNNLLKASLEMFNEALKENYDRDVHRDRISSTFHEDENKISKILANLDRLADLTPSRFKEYVNTNDGIHQLNKVTESWNYNDQYATRSFTVPSDVPWMSWSETLDFICHSYISKNEAYEKLDATNTKYLLSSYSISQSKSAREKYALPVSYRSLRTLIQMLRGEENLLSYDGELCRIFIHIANEIYCQGLIQRSMVILPPPISGFQKVENVIDVDNLMTAACELGVMVAVYFYRSCNTDKLWKECLDYYRDALSRSHSLVILHSRNRKSFCLIKPGEDYRVEISQAAQKLQGEVHTLMEITSILIPWCDSAENSESPKNSNSDTTDSD